VLFVFLEDSLTLRKDLLAKAHHPLAFYIAKIFSVTPVLIILLLLLTVTSYILGLYKWGSVVQFFALLAAEFVVGNVFASLGLCIGAFVRNPSYLMTVTMICLVWVFAFSGFFVPVDQMDPVELDGLYQSSNLLFRFVLPNHSQSWPSTQLFLRGIISICIV